MFDSQKIDSYFEDNASSGIRTGKNSGRRFEWGRLLKIVLPCLAAALLGLMMIIPNLKKNVDLTDNLTMPRKNEMEQLHIEKTEFNITDNKNRVNKIFAQNVHEVESGSQRYKIDNPKGIIPTDNAEIKVTSKWGYFNQENNVLELKKNVRAVVDGNTVLNTEKAIYDFEKSKGWGNNAVEAHGDWGKLKAEAFTYYRQTEILVLKGRHHIKTERGILYGNKETRIYRLRNKTVSVGKAAIVQGDKKLYADKIVAYFSNNSKRELVKAEAYGNVRIITNSEKVLGQEGYYWAQSGKIVIHAKSKDGHISRGYVSVKQKDRELRADKVTLYLAASGKNELRKAYAEGKLKIITQSELITAQEGVYTPQSGHISLYGTAKNVAKKQGVVEIIQGENVLHAQRVEVYLDDKKQINHADAFGGVEVLTPKGAVWGDKGVYNPAGNKVELFDNVRLEQNNNYIIGAHAETDLATSISRITGDESTKGRIHGTFYKKRK